ncbi:protein TonB [Variovorax boronicumulans]|uniref:energy transducer TonB n=1 Tax=Variovorax boronicumulans TaxID=436515 RepID=UPI0024743378|nr:energy transducer TonB [Variovorax boronicumulans]MDH6166207.1 protein TonB [Variovorax boronicumulans]
MKTAFLWGGAAVCAALVGCAVPQRDVVDIAEPAQVPVPPPELPPPPVIEAPPAGPRRPEPLAVPPATPAVQTSAQILQRHMPDYPAALADEGVEGQVIAVFYVGEAGTPEDVRIERSPHPLLSKAVLDALKGWRFEPARSADGRPVRTRMRLPFRFQGE